MSCIDGSGDGIVVNTFMFCRDHGWELCGHCICDYRPGNNAAIEDEIADLSEDFNFDERQPIDVFGAGASHHKGEQYKCITHKKVDCGSCFDWVKLVRAEAEEAAKTERWLEKRKKWLEKVDS